MLVAPASMLFSTSSLTAVAKVSTTCPEQIWCTECLSIALMAPAGSELQQRKSMLNSSVQGNKSIKNTNISIWTNALASLPCIRHLRRVEWLESLNLFFSVKHRIVSPCRPFCQIVSLALLASTSTTRHHAVNTNLKQVPRELRRLLASVTCAQNSAASY